LPEFSPREYTCDFADTAIGLYVIVFGIAALVAVVHFFRSANYERLFGWMYSGRHYGNRAVRKNQRAAVKEFARLMQRQVFDDARMATLLQNMGALEQRRWHVKYEERRKQAERLRELVEAQRKAIREDTVLASDLEQRELDRTRAIIRRRTI
jgi:hypothetical protein